MLAVGPVVDEGVEELGAMRAFRYDSILLDPRLEVFIILVVLVDAVLPFVGPPVLSYLIKDINLIIGCLHVVLCALLDLEGDVAIEF